MVKKTQFEPEVWENRPVFVGWWRPLLVVLAGYAIAGVVITLLWCYGH